MYFSADYSAAKSRFRKMAENAGVRLESIGLSAKGPEGEALGVDVAWFGPDKPRKVLLHSSGLHGVEGFAGSAIQLRLLETLPSLPNDAAFLLVHVLNPFGMSWLRRVNENNVDLNRNFLGDAPYSGAPDSYADFDSFLNPASPPRRDFFMLKAPWLIVRHGMPALKQTVAGGQYEYPKGLFFGGSRLEEGPAKYRSLLQRRLASAEHVVSIDVHTGLGSYGESTLLVEPGDYDALRPVFGDRVVPSAPKDSPAYRVRGGIHSMIKSAAPEAVVECVCQEFGTYGPIRVLHALREENRWQHFGAGTLKHRSKTQLKEAFCPSDGSWQKSILEKGSALLDRAIERVSKL